jgi:predicted DNA-binding transcriptional regulator AlpA
MSMRHLKYTTPADDTHTKPSRPAARESIEPLTWRLNDVCRSLGLSRRTIERERSAGRFPAPDLVVGRTPLWQPATIRSWIESKGRTSSAKGGGHVR